MSTEPTWRVYLPEWQFVYTSDVLGEPGIDECLIFYRQRYEGRVREEDWRTVPAVMGARGPQPQALQLRLPNLRGEFKDYDTAVEWASHLADQIPSGDQVAVVVVQRGSVEERELLEYGKKMLPDAG